MSKIAVFFDAENVGSDKLPGIISYLSTKGDIFLQRAYADWSIPNSKGWMKQIAKTPITAIQQFHHNQEQAVDKVIMMDAIEQAIKNENIEIFSIVASDSGYYSLALRLRELGKKVIGIGDKEKCLPIWVNSCNEFVYFEDLEEEDDDILLQKEGKKGSGDFGEFALEQFLERAFKTTRTYKDTNTILASQFWESVRRLKPDFQIKDYGYKSPTDFLLAFPNKFKLSDDGKPQRTLFIELVEENSNGTSEHGRKTGFVKKEVGRYRILEADDGSGEYFFYLNEINKEFKHEKCQEGTKVDFLVVRAPNPKALELRDQTGRAKDLMVITK